MKKSALALFGGKRVRDASLPPRPSLGLAERNAVNNVLSSDQLSGFVAEPGKEFYGGHCVRSLERAWRERFKVKYAVAMNSATSCLFGAVQALAGPRDRVVVTPWSMSASATCVLEARGTPVFADIEPNTYAIDERPLDGNPKAIVLVHLFGRPAQQTLAIRDVCREKGIALIEDASQAPGATRDGQLVGTFGDVGVFSLNHHKQIRAGEGGVAVTNRHDVADFLQCYRNHGEVRGFRRAGHWGGNYRMTEMEAAVGEVQLDRLDELTEPRIRNAERLTEALGELGDEIRLPRPSEAERCVYYLYAIHVPEDASRFAAALTAEGVPASPYVSPLYHLSVFRSHARIDDSDDWRQWYPNMEDAYRHVVVIPHVHGGMAEKDLDDIATAFRKVWQHRDEL